MNDKETQILFALGSDLQSLYKLDTSDEVRDLMLYRPASFAELGIGGQDSILI